MEEAAGSHSSAEFMPESGGGGDPEAKLENKPPRDQLSQQEPHGVQELPTNCCLLFPQLVRIPSKC